MDVVRPPVVEYLQYILLERTTELWRSGGGGVDRYTEYDFQGTL